ncbi:hypothetical protein G6F56_005252 [Rhizopus delemar]|nr:hypothetical protein G6F56_005252 [Rhizopus delemar]
MHSPSKNINQFANLSASYSLANKEKKDKKNIIQGRLTTSDTTRPNIRESNRLKKLNKWFAIETEDIELLREDLRYWRSLADVEKIPPMTVSIYLDTSRLTPNQTLLAADDNLRWGSVDVLHVNRILIESWVLKLKQPSSHYAEGWPNMYKRSIVFFRSLHSFVRLMPTSELYRRMSKPNRQDTLSIGYRLSSDPSMQYDSEISLNSTILENDVRKPTNSYEFSDIMTPNGMLNLSVTYRRNCDFKVEDRERDLSAQFIDMDEHYFTPSGRWSRSGSVTLKKSTSSFSRNPGDILRPKSRTVSPFKSPSLSSSLQMNSSLPTKDTESFPRKYEIMSSFEKYKSKESPLNSIKHKGLTLNQDDDGLGDFLRLMTPKQDLRFQCSLSSSVSSDSSSHKKALSHFHSLRDIHNSLSESLSSSMVITQEGSQVSSLSSISRSYQPTMPSPLHMERNPSITQHDAYTLSTNHAKEDSALMFNIFGLDSESSSDMYKNPTNQEEN